LIFKLLSSLVRLERVVGKFQRAPDAPPLARRCRGASCLLVKTCNLKGASIMRCIINLAFTAFAKLRTAYRRKKNKELEEIVIRCIGIHFTLDMFEGVKLNHAVITGD
jgi:hypothetical protein